MGIARDSGRAVSGAYQFPSLARNSGASLLLKAGPWTWTFFYFNLLLDAVFYSSLTSMPVSCWALESKTTPGTEEVSVSTCEVSDVVEVEVA